ncbi:MAG TPA: TauD/TfdA family dioxygenase [Rhizomicrobium sp.]|nr:TauD/TfdA family dioxygenase [Rhizomicrobium sp.]
MSAVASRAQSNIGANIVVRPATPVIGAEIEGIDLSRPLSPEEVNDVHRALLQWKVLFFRDQPITDEQQLAFGRYFGKLTPAHPIMLGLPHQPAIWERAAADYAPKYRPDLNIPTSRPNRDYKGWHIDITFVANPNKYSILRGVEIPPYGGDTLWSNLEAAYEGLSPQIRNLIDGLQVVHRTNSYDSGWKGEGRRDTGPLTALHPVVRVHPETGRKHLFINPGTSSHIVGLKERESQALIDLLADEISRPEYQVRFHWSPHALVIWDNRATAHAGPIDYAHFKAPRIVRRITVAGDLPKGPDGFVSRPLEGELFGTLDD